MNTECTMLFEITEKNYPVVLDLRYATKNNFMNKIIYPSARCFLGNIARPAWEKTLDLCERQGWTLKIFDAFRPPESQQELWNICPDTTYVAHPEKGSHHSRGTAIDLTIMRGGQELDMGTDFDDLSQASHHGAFISKEPAHNRYLLAGLMASAGWVINSNEWWHYQLPNAGTYPLIQKNWWDHKIVS